MSRKELFDKVALSCISYLESFEECTGVDFQAGDGCGSQEFATWEKKNAPFKLPKDFRSFYSLFNSVGLNWHVSLGNNSVSIGEFRLNGINDIQRIPVEGIFESSFKKKYDSISANEAKLYGAFLLDSQSEVGEIVMLFRPSISGGAQDDDGVTVSALAAYGSNSVVMQPNQLENPEIWLLDASGRWHFVCFTFTQYLRLMVAHLGIYGWQLAFTPEGLPVVTQQWMNMFSKERLVVDRQSHEQKLK
jgi:hypothetical protein